GVDLPADGEGRLRIALGGGDRRLSERSSGRDRLGGLLARLGPAGLVVRLDGEAVRDAVVGAEGLAPGRRVADLEAVVHLTVAVDGDAEPIDRITVLLGGRPGPVEVEEPVS